MSDYPLYPAETILVERTARATGTRVQLVYAWEADPDQPWETICVDHGGVCSHETRRLAADWLSHPDEWCEDCMHGGTLYPNHRPAPRATSPEEDTMAGKPDPKPTKSAKSAKTSKASKTTTKRPIPSDDVAATDAALRGEETPATTRSTKTSKGRKAAETKPETAPEPVVELPTRDESPADLAAAAIQWAEEATEASLDRVAAESGVNERVRVGKTTIAYLKVGKTGASFNVKQADGWSRTLVRTADDVPAAGRALAETLQRIATKEPVAS